MPRKRNNSKLNLIKKQKELIQKRLMQISLKVDDYAYNYKAISTREAEAYIQEVMGCQDKCTDDRSLQVIEKLLHCLKGIIEEQNECQALNSDVTLAEYDEMDEDITPLTQEIQAIDVELNKTSTNKTVVALTNVSLTKHVNVHENTPIDLSVNSRHGNEAVEHKNDEINALHTAISELSIQEKIALSGETNNLQTYSQSVLAEFNSNDIVINSYKPNENLDRIQMEIDNGMQATTETEFEKTKTKYQPNTSLIANSEDFKETMQVNNISSEIVKNNNNTGKRKLLNVISLANNIADVRTTEFTADTQQEMLSNAVKKKTQKKPRKINRQVNKDPGKVTKQSRKKTKLTKDNNKNKEEFRNNTQNMTNKNGNNKNKCKLKLDDAIVLPENIKQNFETEVINNKTQNEFSEIHLAPDNSINLYAHQNTLNEERNTNKQVVNDLSWIENIRYVREVSLEENMPSYYEDNFWNSYTLPKDWNDSEFL